MSAPGDPWPPVCVCTDLHISSVTSLAQNEADWLAVCEARVKLFAQRIPTLLSPVIGNLPCLCTHC